MVGTRDVATIVGSLRRDSLNRLTAKALARLAPENLRLEIVEIGDLPLYNQDLDEQPPPQWVAFRDRIKAADAVLFVTPEYNRSIPAPLKNAIDVGSRPYGSSAWDGKPGGVVSVSPGAVGGFGANHHLRQTFVFLNIPVVQQPEAYLGGAGDSFGEDGEPDARTSRFLGKYVAAYANWVELCLAGKAVRD